MPKYIFVTGGVMSGLGKGITTSSLAKILQRSHLTVTCMKVDPYINFDAGTMNPIAHGEVFVTDDGGECDMDLGNYERFLNKDLSKEEEKYVRAHAESLFQKQNSWREPLIKQLERVVTSTPTPVGDA